MTYHERERKTHYYESRAYENDSAGHGFGTASIDYSFESFEL